MKPLAGRIAAVTLLGACADERICPRPGGGSPSLSQTTAPLAAGTALPVLVPLDPAQRRSIGAFVREGVVRCTGTLVAERRVLTAAHCFAHEPNLQGFDFVVVTGLGRVALPLQSIAAHATLDLALVTLGATSKTDADAAVVPLRREALGAEDVSAPVEAAGAGLGSTGDVLFAQLAIAGVTESQLELAASAGQGICSGDSGGPILSVRNATTEIVGISSTSAPNCASPAFAVRVDVAAQWLDIALASPLPPPNTACDAASDSTRCDAGREGLCRDGYWHERDCIAHGLFCGARPGGGDGCLPAPCGSVDRHGLCDDGRALWCGASGLEVVDCAARGLGCDISEDANGYRCVECDATGGRCLEKSTDETRCGTSGRACGVGEACDNEQCVPSTADSDPPDALAAPSGAPITSRPALGCGAAVASRPSWVALVWLLLTLIFRRRSS